MQLSRDPICLVTQGTFALKIIDAQSTDDSMKAIKEILKTKLYDGYSLKNNVYIKLVIVLIFWLSQMT